MPDETAIRILGPLEVRHRDQPVDLGVRRQRLIFGILVLWAGQPVQIGRLITAAWSGHEPPVTARNAIQICISRLRATLGGVASISTVGDGYRLDADPGVIDLHCFRQHVASARNVDGERRVAELRQAESLWRGPVLSGELPEDVRDWLCAGISEERVAALEERIEAELALGLHHQLIGELTDLVRAHPTRERMIGQLMLALYRDGQAARALQVCRETRALFSQELGIEPGALIRDLEVDILRQAPGLLGTVTAVPAPFPIPAQLPRDERGFTGRDDQIAALDGLVKRDLSRGARIVLIVGTAGVGKTALAVHWAHRVRERFPDGQLYADLRGYSADAPVRVIDALTRILLACGMPADRISADETAAVNCYRSLLAERRMLIVLDNARSAEQVRPLLPGGPHCAVVVTSRDRLDGLLVRDGARRLDLTVLAPAESRSLLAEALGAERVQSEQAAVTELAALCAHLPLALRIAAAALHGQPARAIAGYVARLRAGNRLTALSVDGDPDSAVRAAFDLSYAALTAPLRRIFAMISLMPGTDFTVDAVTALVGNASDETGVAFARLVGMHLLDEPSPGRYRMHDLLQLYAAEHVADEEDQTGQAQAMGRLLTWYLDASRAASRRLYGGGHRSHDDLASTKIVDFTTDAEAITWLNAERANLAAAVVLSHSHGFHTTTWQLAHELRIYFWRTRHTAEWMPIAQAGLAAALATADPRAEAAMRLNFGALSQCLAQPGAAAENYATAYELATSAGWTAIQLTCLTHLGTLHLAGGDLAAADGFYQRSLELIRQEKDWASLWPVLTNLGLVRYQRGQLRAAEALQAEAVQAARRAGNPGGEASALQYLGYCVHAIGDLDRALTHLTQALPIHQRIGNRRGEAQTLMDIAAVHSDADRPELAESGIEAALAIIGGTGDRNVEALALNIRGNVKLKAGHPQEAFADHLAARDLALAARGLYPQAESLIGLANAACAAQRFSEARSHAKAASAIAQDAGFQVPAAHALTAMAMALAQEGSQLEAIDKAVTAIALYRDTGSRLGEARALAALGQILAASDPAASAEHQRVSRSILRDCGAAEAPISARA